MSRCSRSAISSSDDIRLDGVLGGVRRVARHDSALVEGAGAEVRAATGLAAVAPTTEHDRALLLHGAVSAGQASVPQRVEAPRLRVAALHGEPRRAVVLQGRGHELAAERPLARVPRLAATRVQTPLQVGLHPRTAATAATEPALGAEVD